MLTCPSCGQENPHGFRFCGACAAPLATEPSPRREERKVVTVLFADLVGFTARAERLDPEDVRALLAPYHERLRAELERFGGTVEKFIGDAVMAVFGAPIAHEDDPERAVRAALAICDWVAEDAAGLDVRVGVNTGEALVALNVRPSEGEAMAAGDVVNTAARIQAGAPVNTILVGEQTYRATAHAIDYHDAEAVVAKGKSEPIAVWEALQTRARHGIDVAQRPAVPLVGRQRELELLVSTLARVREERAPQLVTLVGVPGIGKSRLVYELSQAVERGTELITWRQGRSLPYGEGVTFWALGEIVKAQAGILENDSAAEAAAKLERAVAELAPDPEEAQWLDAHLRPLIGIGGAESGAGAGEPFAAWRRFLELLAERRPLVLVFEDLHWADDALLDFVDGLVDRVSDVPLLVLATARPEFLERRPGWGGGKTNAVTLSLPPLPDDDSARLVSTLLDRPLLAAERQHALLMRIGGNPLYAEQYARAFVERGDLVDLPETVQGIIAARLDGLSQEEKRVLQDAAVVGKVFWLAAVEAIAGLARAELDEILHRLERKQFVQRARRSAVAGEAEFAFRHVLLRDVAYGQIPRSARAQKHQRAAEWLESLGRADDHAEMLADHYVNAVEFARASGGAEPELVERAHRALRDAGDRAAALAAYAAAVGFYESALELSPGDAGDRGALLLRLGRARFAAESAGAEELEAALEALRAAGDNEGAAEAAVALRTVAWYEGDRDRADAWLDEALALVRERPDSPAKAQALVARAGSHFVAGEYVEALRLGREALPLVERLGLDAVRARVLNTVGISRVFLGEPEGVGDLEQAVAIAREANAFEQLHGALNNLSEAQFFLGNIAEGAQTYEELVEIMERFGRDTDRRWGRAALAGIRAGEGRWDEAISLADEFIAETEAGSPHYLEPICRVVRASIRLARGDAAGASTDSERALQVARPTRDAQAVAPALHARATVLLAEGRRDEADALAGELLTLGPKLVVNLGGVHGTGIIELAWFARELGRESELLMILASAPAVPWALAARAVASRDFQRAAAVLAEIGFRPGEAYTRLRAAQELAGAGKTAEAEGHLEAALAFYREVGATHFIREGEALRVTLKNREPAQRSRRAST
ncbi:MAG: AAA family ATPase [Actinobacteria bacterium]|nr:AAA family ATPase [Actinomycetota bacterium]